MGAKKKLKLMAMVQADLNTGLQAILSDSSLPVGERAAAARRTLRQPGLPAAICRVALDWLMAQRGSSVTDTVLAGSLSLPGAQAAVEAEPEMLDRLLPAAASAAAAVASGEVIGASAGDSRSAQGQPGRSAVSLDLSALPADWLIGPAVAAAGRALLLPDSSESSDSADSAAGGPLLRRLCERLSSVTDPSESLRAAYLSQLLTPSLRLAASRPEIASVIRGPFEAIALGAEGLLALSAAAAAAAARQAHETAEGPAKELLDALQNLSATDPTLGAELLALLAGILLREKTPLAGVSLLAKCLGISTNPPSEASLETSQTSQAGTDDVTVLPLSVRLGLLGRLARCLREARVSLTSSAGGQTLLQWLRSTAAAAAASTGDGAAAAAAAWYDCAAELMRVSPLVLPLQGRLGPVLARALGDCHDKDANTAAAASHLVQLTISTYSELRQLPRLLPQLLLSARQLRTAPPQQQRKVKTKVLRLTAEQETLLSSQLSRLPQPQVLDVWRTLLYHLGEDGVAAMKRGDESADSISSVLTLTLQLVAVFLSHAAVVDQSAITAATRALLPALMTQTAQTLQQMAALVTRTHQSSDHVAGLLSTCLAWRRLQSALLHYSAAYRAEMVTSPLAPLGEKRWQKLSKLEAPGAGTPCGQLMAEFLSEAARVAPADWQPPGAGAGAEPVCGPGRPLSGATLARLSTSQLGRLLPSGAECRPLPLALAALLAGRLTALPSLGGKRKCDCSRPPQQLAAALRDAAAAALGADDGSSPTPPPPPEEVWDILEGVGACLESASDWTKSSDETSPPHEDPKPSKGETASLTRPLQLVLSLPLEHLSEPAASLLLGVLCLCLLRIPARGRGRELALSALSALLVSAGCRRPLERIQPGRLLAWLATAPPSLSPATLPSSVTELEESPLENGMSFLTDNKASDDLNGTTSPPDHLEPSPCKPHLFPSSCTSVRRSGGCSVAAARRAVLLCYSGRRAALLAPAADGLVCRLQEGASGHGAVDTIVELLQHFVQTNTALKGSDVAVKQQAKSVSARLPRLLTDLPSVGQRQTLASLALLVPLRAHKPPGSGKPARWRRLLVEVFPAALEAAGETQEEEGEKMNGERRERGEGEAARELLVSVCAAREHLKSELPPTFVMDVWRCVRASDVTADQLRTVLTSSDDSEMEQIVTELTEDTMSLPVDAPSAGRWRRLLAQWRALASCGQLPAAGRAQQRRGLTRLLRRLAGCTPQLAAGPGEVQQLLVPAVEAAAAAVAQKHVRLSDTAYTDSLQCCQLELTSVTTAAACGAIQAVCDLLWQLVCGHPAAVATRLPLLAQVVQSMADEVCLRGVQERQPTPEDLALLVAAANRITRVVRELVQLGPLSEPLAPYLIADLVTLIQRAPLDAEVQEAITASMFCLLTQCRDEVITRLRVTLPATVSHLFHTTVNTYKKFHKFVGRV